MNIVSTLTLRHLLGNKKRSVVTILGIAASTALISAIVLGVFSFFKFFGFISIQSDGNAHAQFSEITQQQFNELKEDDRIDSVGLCDIEETVTGVRLLSGKDERFCVGNTMHADYDYMTMRVVTDYDGQLPKNSSEIAIEEQFLIDNGLENLKIGDTLTFEQGYRYTYDELEGLIYLGGNYRSDEQFKALSTETCTVTAILHGNRPTGSWDILRGLDEGFFPEKDKTQVIITLKNCNHTALKQLKSIASDYEIAKCDYNTEYLLSCFAFEGSGGAYRSFFVMMAVALAIVIATSVILIFNSIGMSLTERMRYLGMLASVGATAKQKRFSIYYEGFVLGMIGIPLGLLFGYLGTKITLSVLGSKILEADMFVGAEGLRGSIPVVCEPSVIAAIVFFAALTILISTFVPAIRAAKVMPIDALRQSNVVKVKAKSLRVNPIIRKIFGYEGELAYKNIKRNGVKGKVITATIAVSVILFLTINYFCNSIARANDYEINIPYQLVASCSFSESDRLRSAISEMEDVDDVYSASMIQFRFKKAPESQIELANTDIADSKFLLPGFADLYFSGMDVVIVDDEDFNKILEDNGLDKNEYYGDTLKGVLLNDYFREKKSSEVFNDGILGQVLHYDKVQGYPPAIEIAAFVRYDENNKTFDLSPKGNIAAFVPVSMYYEKAKEVLPEDKLTMDLGVETADHEVVHDRIYALLESDGYHSYYCGDLTDAVKAMDTITLMLKTAMYGFTILLTLIAIANIVNTISTGVLLRRKEFAMYKSVGLENSGFKKMIRLETLLYGIKALVWGISISLLLSYLMFTTFDTRLHTFNPDLLMYVVTTIAVFGILGLSMALSISKIKDDNIIEALKEDAV
ncbi:putative ABC transport system permease protein [Butyrivibrio sp. ob235]|uniref:ABC transporter permease n=1 Tax=Butyrivibrio sp. ob235 TaxID=1761780 RepID=UPI0008AEE6DE|nr:ABC transporter permease [Butyrivibrio sp. ob235]SEM35855.1 putative ABC transport system permease protein [Butyrivibrio sp. ob235]